MTGALIKARVWSDLVQIFNPQLHLTDSSFLVATALLFLQLNDLCSVLQLGGKKTQKIMWHIYCQFVCLAEEIMCQQGETLSPHTPFK